MKLTWSHAVLQVRDMDKMIDFYTNVLGFEISDRGPLGPNPNPEIVFFSQYPDEHHQLAMINIRKDEEPANSLNHLAFRTPDFEDVQSLHAKLATLDGIQAGPLCHGNALSVYFNDPEGNGVEVFWDTPWHVAQPQGKPWDINMSKDQALAWVQENFGQEDTFEPREDYYQRRNAEAN